jgi:hypothetical protein
MQANVADSVDQTQPNPIHKIMPKRDPNPIQPNPTHGQLWTIETTSSVDRMTTILCSFFADFAVYLQPFSKV